MEPSIGPPIRYGNRTEYQVNVIGETILTIVTMCPLTVNSWIEGIVARGNGRTGLIVGLDVFRRPAYSASFRDSIACIQLCVGRECLIYKFGTPLLPIALIEFLWDRSNIFVGVGIRSSLDLLVSDYRIGANAFYVDLAVLASLLFNMPILRLATLRMLSIGMLERDFVKPPLESSLTLFADITAQEALYGSIDPFVSAEVAKVLMFAN